MAGAPDYQAELSRKRRLFADELAEQGCGDYVGPGLFGRVDDTLKLSDLHWRYADDAEVRRYACAYACALRFRDRLAA